MTQPGDTHPEMPEISVIVVNYGTADMAIAAVESVLGQSHNGRTVEVHLVDNASPGGDIEVLRQAHATGGWADQVTLWAEDDNHGFARGNNVVLRALAKRETPPKYVFLLNPDAWIEEEAIAALADHLDRTPEAAAVGGGNFDGKGVPTAAAFRFPSILGEFERGVNFGPVSRLLKRFRVALPPEHPSGPVDWVAGASVMFRFTALSEAGFFNPSYFLYYEEVDLMRRLKEKGWEIHYLPEARVQHIAGAATGVDDSGASANGDDDIRRQPDYLYRSWRRYFSYSGRGYALVAATSIAVGCLLGASIAWLRRRPRNVPDYFWRDHWRYVLSPLLGLRRDAVYDADSARSNEVA